MGIKVGRRDAAYPFSKMTVKKAVQTLRFGGWPKHAAATEVLRGAVAKDSADAVYELLLYRLQQVENVCADVDGELRSLTDKLDALASADKARALVAYARAIALYADRGVAAAAEVRALLETAAGHMEWYRQAIDHFETGLACAAALDELERTGDGARLFGLMLAEVDRIGYQKPPSPHLLRAIVAPRFVEWLAGIERAPVAFDGDPVRAFNNFQYCGNNKCEHWPAGRREVLRALLSYGGEGYKIDEAFKHMCELGDLDAARFLHQLGIGRNAFGAGLRAAAHGGHGALLRQFVEWGLRREQIGEAMASLLWTEHTFSPEAFRVLVEAGANVKAVREGEPLLHRAVSRANIAGVRMLLDHGADPTAKNKDGKTAAQVAAKAGWAEVAKLLREVADSPPPTEITVGEAREHALGRKLAPRDRTAIDGLLPESKAGVELTSALGDPSDPMGVLSRVLVGVRAGAEPRSEASLHLDETSVIESGLAIEGELLITGHVLVLGDVVAGEITVDETGSLAVAGDVTARATYCGGYLQLAGTLDSAVITAFDGGYIRADAIRSDLAILYAYSGYDANRVDGPAFTLDHGVEVDDPSYRAAEKLVAESCLADGEADFGVGRIDFRKLIRAATAGQRFLR